jgi:WD40 repeat protein
MTFMISSGDRGQRSGESTRGEESGRAARVGLLSRGWWLILLAMLVVLLVFGERWLGTSGASVRTAWEQDGSIVGLAFDPVEGQLVSLDTSGRVVVWEVDRNRRRGVLGGGHRFVESVAVDPGGGLLAMGGRDGSIGLWDLRRWESAGELAPSGGKPVRSLAFSPDGKILASGRAGGRLTLWEVEGRRVRSEETQAHRAFVSALAFSPVG